LAHLLIVDDDPDVLDAFCASLSGMGHEIWRASSGLEALEILDEKTGFDLLLTDIVMPGLHGFNLARMARLRYPDLRVLYISGFMETIGQDIGPRLGPLLPKPIKPAELRHEVAQALAAGPVSL